MSSAPGSLSLRCRGSLLTPGKSPGQLGGGGGSGFTQFVPAERKRLENKQREDAWEGRD